MQNKKKIIVKKKIFQLRLQDKNTIFNIVCLVGTLGY